jgi:hypothetical protein
MDLKYSWHSPAFNDESRQPSSCEPQASSSLGILVGGGRAHVRLKFMTRPEVGGGRWASSTIAYQRTRFEQKQGVWRVTPFRNGQGTPTSGCPAWQLGQAECLKWIEYRVGSGKVRLGRRVMLVKAHGIGVVARLGAADGGRMAPPLETSGCQKEK